ncbi:MAG: response regulator [Candidatus Hatepunaea meridiana]|nr:response regulator [Candidatus Hatepunaea meridiana]
MNHIRVLIVDDEPDFRELLKDGLSAFGHSIETAPDGETALELLKTFMPHIVLLDVMLKEQSGIKVLESIREIDKQVKIMMISGMLDLGVAKEAILLGAVDYITKPVDFKQIDELIKNLVESTLG